MGKDVSWTCSDSHEFHICGSTPEPTSPTHIYAGTRQRSYAIHADFMCGPPISPSHLPLEPLNLIQLSPSTDRPESASYGNSFKIESAGIRLQRCAPNWKTIPCRLESMRLIPTAALYKCASADGGQSVNTVLESEKLEAN